MRENKISMRNEDGYWHKLVLRKLKHMMMDGLLSADGILYEYEWDEKKERKDNLLGATKEHNLLGYLIQTGVAIGDQGFNEYRQQQLIGNKVDPSFGVWGDWENAPASMREFDQQTDVYGVNIDKFEKELDRFGLTDTGLSLEDKTTAFKQAALPKVVTQVTPDFAIHNGNLISYKGGEIVLEPQPRRIAALIMGQSITGQYTTTEQITSQILADSYMEKAKTSKIIKQRVTDSIYELNTAFKTATGTDKKYFSNRREVGYIFSP